MRLQQHFAGPDATAALARELAPLLRAGDAVLLSGPVGSGKSHFARALIRARLQAVGRDEDIPSPSYTLVQVYDAGGVDIWHADLYRLSAASEVEELGLVEAFEASICVVEWPDRLGPLRPARHLLIALAQGKAPDDRDLIMTAAGDWPQLTPLFAAQGVS